MFSVPQAPQTTENRPPDLEKSSDYEITHNRNESNNSDVTIACDYEKLSTYESKMNDFSNLTESSKVYEKNSLELGKICAKANEMQLNHSNVCEKIENELEKPLKKVHNSDENVDKTKWKTASPVRNGDEAEEEDYRPKTPSMAERRKLFESGRKNSGSEELPDGVTSSKSVESFRDEEQSLERGSGQRSSIAG